MKQIAVSDFTLVHVEVTLGLRNREGKQRIPKDVTAFLQELNKERLQGGHPTMTFKVFSGYAPYVIPDVDPLNIKEEVIENIALLHIDYNPEGQANERFDALTWYLDKLMEHFEQNEVYAHFATDGGHRMLVFHRVALSPVTENATN